jgi:hypothetical protein
MTAVFGRNSALSVLTATLAESKRLVDLARANRAHAVVARAHAAIARGAIVITGGSEDPIRGDNDADSRTVFIVGLLTEGPTCLPCVRRKSESSETEAARALERIGAVLIIRHEPAGRCGVCDTTATPVFWIGGRTPGA